MSQLILSIPKTGERATSMPLMKCWRLADLLQDSTNRKVEPTVRLQGLTAYDVSGNVISPEKAFQEPTMIDSTEVMKRANAAFEKTGMTLEELGKKMGADPDTARMTAWQFLRKSTDPRMSMILRFCEAAGISVGELCGEKASRK